MSRLSKNLKATGSVIKRKLENSISLFMISVVSEISRASYGSSED